MCIVIFLYIFVADLDVLIEIGGSESNDTHVEFVVAALKVFVQLALGNRNAGGQKLLDFVQGNLVAYELFDMIFAEAERRETVLHKIIELIDVESRFALESRQLSHNIGDLRCTRAQSQSFRFMPQNKQVNDELDRGLILVEPGSRCHCSNEFRHAKGLRQTEKSCKLLSFQHGDIPVVDASKVVPANRAVIRTLHEIENEGNRKDRDYDHEPVPMPAQ